MYNPLNRSIRFAKIIAISICIFIISPEENANNHATIYPTNLQIQQVSARLRAAGSAPAPEPRVTSSDSSDSEMPHEREFRASQEQASEASQSATSSTVTSGAGVETRSAGQQEAFDLVEDEHGNLVPVNNSAVTASSQVTADDAPAVQVGEVDEDAGDTEEAEQLEAAVLGFY